MHIKQIITLTIILLFLGEQFIFPLLGNRSILYAENNQQQNLTSLLDDAQKKYYDGEFDSAISLITKIVKDYTLDKNQKITAYKILSQTLQAKGQIESAREVILKIFSLAPTYAPTIEQEPPQFIKLVDETRPESLKEKQVIFKKQKSKKWYWIGGAVIVTAGATAVILLNKGESGQKQDLTLSSPPAWPESY